MKIINPNLLRIWISNTLEERGADQASAHHVSSSLVQASLRGVDSHGIKLVPHYCRALQAGRINGKPEMAYASGGDSVGCLNADHAFGHYAGIIAMQQAIANAEATGIGMVSVANSSHFGAAAYFGLLAANSGFIGMAFTNADSLVRANAAKAPFFGTNPICFCAPLLNEEPFCLDMATSTVSWNKVMNYAAENQDIPEYLAFDSEGRSVTDPSQAASLAPIGTYKGFGLGMMVDILCALLADGPISPDIPPMYGAPIEMKRHVSHCMIAIDVRKFPAGDNFPVRLTDMVTRIRSMEALLPDEPVLVAGDPEKFSEKDRSTNGIPVSDTLFHEFLEVDCGIDAAVIGE